MPNPVDSLAVAWLADEGEFTKGVKQDGVLHAYGDNQILRDDDGQSVSQQLPIALPGPWNVDDDHGAFILNVHTRAHRIVQEGTQVSQVYASGLRR